MGRGGAPNVQAAAGKRLPAAGSGVLGETSYGERYGEVHQEIDGDPIRAAVQGGWTSVEVKGTYPNLDGEDKPQRVTLRYTFDVRWTGSKYAVHSGETEIWRKDRNGRRWRIICDLEIEESEPVEGNSRIPSPTVVVKGIEWHHISDGPVPADAPWPPAA